MKAKKSYIILILFLLVAVFVVASLGINKKGKVRAEEFVCGNTNARIFNSQTSFDITKNGKNGFFAMCGMTCQNLGSDYGTKAGYDLPANASNTKFSTFLSRTFTDAEGTEFFQHLRDGSQTEGFTLVGATKMLIDPAYLAHIGAPDAYTSTRANVVPVRAFKVPMKGTINLTVNAWMDSVQYQNGLAVVISKNTTLLATQINLSSNVLDGRDMIYTNGVWSYTTSLDVNINDMIYVEVHNGVSHDVTYSTAHTTINIEYTATADTAVQEVKTDIENLKDSGYTHQDANDIMSIYDKVALMSDLQKSFITEAECTKLNNAYSVVNSNSLENIYSSYDNYSETDQEQRDFGFYYMHGPNGDVGSFENCLERIEHDGVSYWKGAYAYTWERGPP